MGRIETSQDFKYQPWTRYRGTPTESLAIIKGLVQYRRLDWSPGIDPWYRPLEIDSESDEEVHEPPSNEEGHLPQQGPLPTKRGLTFLISRS
eukprot:3102197-Heterocapsa_arctica.AAC.1